MSFFNFGIAVNAAEITVNTLSDEDNGDLSGPTISLREAIKYGNANDTVKFSVVGTILLLDELNIDKNLTIIGPGANVLTVSGNHNSKIFDIDSGVTVYISDLSVKDGLDTGNEGGGITNRGTLTIERCIISNNETKHDGGGIYNSDGTLTVRDTTISDNIADYLGGGINNNDGMLTIENCTISNNKVVRLDSDEGAGGGIFSYQGFSIINSTISGNQAVGDGGGIYVEDDGNYPIIIDFTTFTKNIADSDNDGSGDGGGIFAESEASVNIKNSIVAANDDQSPGGNVHPDCSGSGDFVTGGGNVIGNNAGCDGDFPTGDPNGNGDMVGSPSDPIDPRLGPLSDNGGETETHALLSDSPAIDGAADCHSISSSFVPEDQRHIGRPQGPNCDSGAYELELLPIPTIGFSGMFVVLALITVLGAIGIRKRRSQGTF